MDIVGYCFKNLVKGQFREIEVTWDEELSNSQMLREKLLQITLKIISIHTKANLTSRQNKTHAQDIDFKHS